jgi:ribosomal protein S18 acetylase RimI-like enzyme
VASTTASNKGLDAKTAVSPPIAIHKAPGGRASAQPPVKKPVSGGHRREDRMAKEARAVVAQAEEKAEDGRTPKWRVRLMNQGDVEEVLRIQRACYDPEYREQPESYQGRIRLYPEGNVVIEVPVLESNGSEDELDQDSSSSSSDGDNDSDSDEHEREKALTKAQAKVTYFSPSASPTDDSKTVHSVKKRCVVPPTKHKSAIKWRLAGYIQAQPFPRGTSNDVNDLLELERWLAKRQKKTEKMPEDVIYIHEIAVDPCHRGKGLTAPMTNYVDQLTASEGVSMTTLVSLGPALGFWQRNGFIRCRDIEYGGHVCYYMEKPLPNDAKGFKSTITA